MKVTLKGKGIQEQTNIYIKVLVLQALMKINGVVGEPARANGGVRESRRQCRGGF